MTASTALAKRGYEVVLVEKEENLGGMLNQMNKIGPIMTDTSELIEEKNHEVTQHPMITVFTAARVSANFITARVGSVLAVSNRRGVSLRRARPRLVLE